MLSFWENITTHETTTSTAYDTMTVTIRNTSGTVLSNNRELFQLEQRFALGIWHQKDRRFVDLQRTDDSSLFWFFKRRHSFDEF